MVPTLQPSGDEPPVARASYPQGYHLSHHPGAPPHYYPPSVSSFPQPNSGPGDPRNYSVGPPPHHHHHHHTSFPSHWPHGYDSRQPQEGLPSQHLGVGMQQQGRTPSQSQQQHHRSPGSGPEGYPPSS